VEEHPSPPDRSSSFGRFDGIRVNHYGTFARARSGIDEPSGKTFAARPRNEIGTRPGPPSSRTGNAGLPGWLAGYPWCPRLSEYVRSELTAGRWSVGLLRLYPRRSSAFFGWYEPVMVNAAGCCCSSSSSSSSPVDGKQWARTRPGRGAENSECVVARHGGRYAHTRAPPKRTWRRRKLRTIESPFRPARVLSLRRRYYAGIIIIFVRPLNDVF